MNNNIYKCINLAIFIILSSIFYFFISCSPSKEYLIKQNKTAGIDRLHIRVLLKKESGRVLISSKTRMKISEVKSGKILYDGHGKDMYFQSDQVSRPILIESWGSPLNVDKERYRGMIEIHNVVGKLYIINVIRINEYLYGVVPCEIISSWDIESLKAQAVAARTYTYYHLINNKKTIYDLDCSNNFQVYKGFNAEKDATNTAVDETSGKIAIYSGKPILAFFHSTCGGKTMDNNHVWEGEKHDYLKSVSCKFCNDSPYYTWETNLSLYEIRESLSKKYRGVGKITGINFQWKDKRVISAVIRHSKNTIIKLSGNDLRMLFPEKKIKSMHFTAKKTKDGLILSGHGWGHGVGLCQWGAKGMAEKGANYKDILKYYYRGISIMDAGQNDYAGR